MAEQRNRSNPQTVVVLGASRNPSRYANMAVRELLARGHRVIPVSPNADEVEGLPVKASLGDVNEAVDTLTVYVNATHSGEAADDVVALHPGRVIFNPGAENDALETRLWDAGIAVMRACTLVLLRTGQF